MASRAVYHVHELLTHIAEQLWHGDKPDYKTLYRLSLASEFGNKVAQPILWKSLHSHDALTVFFPHNRGLDYPSPWQWSFDWQPSGWFTLNDGSPFSVPISSHYRPRQVTSFNIDPGHEVPTELLKISNFVRHFTLWLEFLDNFSNFSEALQVNYLFPKLTSLVIVLGDVFTLAPMTKLFPPTLRDVSFLCSSPFLAFEALDQIHNLGLPLRSIRIICNTTPLICTTLPRYILCMTSLTELWVRRCTVSQQDFLSILQIPTLITLDFSIPRMWTPEHPCHFPRGLPLAPLTSLSLRWSSPVFNRFVLDLLTHLLLLHTLELSLSTSCDTDLLEELLASLAELTQLNHIVIMYTPPHGVLYPQYYSAPSTLFRPVIKACQLKHLVIGNLALADMGLLADLIVSHQPLIEYLELTTGSNYSSDPPPPGWFFDWRDVVAILTACPALRHIRVPFYTPWRISDDVPPNVRLHSHRLLVHTSEIACWSGDWSCTHSFLSSLIPLMVLSKYIIDQ